MRKTKIVCTLGPATDAKGVLREMVEAGMNVARFNFSHGTHHEHKARLETLATLREELGVPVASLLDTRGPEIRLGNFKGGGVDLSVGQRFVLTPREVEGDETTSTVSFKNLWQDVTVSSRILFDDGKIELAVVEIRGEDILCEVLNSGRITDHKGVNAPGVHLSMPYLSPADRSDLLFGIANGFDFIAASFTRSARDVEEIRQLLDEGGGEDIKIIAKIENQEGVSNIDEILSAADGIMIARGDMGVEIDFTEIPILQKKLIEKCYRSGRPAITATQMLESMIQNPRPTRAEITDVANAIYDGTSAIMLSGETAAGKYPVQAVRTMAAIAQRTEEEIAVHDQSSRRRRADDAHLTVAGAVAHATCTTAYDTGAAAILTVTHGGETARMLSRYRPPTPIIACVMSERVYRQLALSWGIIPITMPYAHNTDELIALSVEAAQNAGAVHDGDLLVITAGVPVGVSGTTNMLKVHLVGDALVTGVGVGNQNAVGRVCIIADTGDLAHFKHGDVLVTGATTNTMLSAMKEAAAIITEDGGMGSHAAIVGLTLEKPVVVGAVGATTKLSDGLMVTVDSQRGIVRELPE